MAIKEQERLLKSAFAGLPAESVLCRACEGPRLTAQDGGRIKPQFIALSDMVGDDGVANEGGRVLVRKAP